jgi:carboxymethylenebutenolidase
MESEIVEVKTLDGVANAYLARPDDAPHRGVLFISDAFGLRPAIEEMVDRVAADGYVVLAPNVFYRAGRSPIEVLPDRADPEASARAFRSVLPLIEQLTPPRIASDGGSYLDSPHRSAGDLKPVELYFGFADQDQGMNSEQIATLEQALRSAGVRFRAEVYEGAHHGYAVGDSPAYDEVASERQFRELRELLQRTLGQVNGWAGARG